MADRYVTTARQVTAEFKLLTTYGYHDGLTLFTAQRQDPSEAIYLFRLEGELYADVRTYKADGFDVTVKENEIDRAQEQ